MSPYTVKRLVCLASSRKPQGRCIAGKELLADGRPGKWVRPVSGRENEGVSAWERRYRDGGEPRVLDVMDVPLLSAQPNSYQAENWVIASGRRWRRVDRMAWSQLAKLVDPLAPLWTNSHSTFHGTNDRVPMSAAENLDHSLRLVEVNQMRLFVSAPGADFDNPARKVQGRFRHGGTDYWLRVTDPEYERTYLEKPDGTYSIGKSLLTVSLGAPHEGYAYKLIAAIIRP